MSLQIFTRAKNCIKLFILASLFQIFLVDTVFADWSLDVTRRQRDLRQRELENNGSKDKQSTELLGQFFSRTEPTQEIVILNTTRGFVPNTIRLQMGNNYRVHVVNIDKNRKNVSFVLDAFSEHHATFFGRKKTFSISPKREGVFSFQCPESSYEGRVVVYRPARRRVASE